MIALDPPASPGLDPGVGRIDQAIDAPVRGNGGQPVFGGPGLALGPFDQPQGWRELAEPVERAPAQGRAWVEDPFHIVKTCFATRSCATAAWPNTLFALANLVIVKQVLLARAGG